MSKICVVLNRVFIFNSNLKLVFPDRFVFQYIAQWNLVYLGVLDFLQKLFLNTWSLEIQLFLAFFSAFYDSWKGHCVFNLFMKLLCEILFIFLYILVSWPNHTSYRKFYFNDFVQNCLSLTWRQFLFYYHVYGCC